MPDFPQLGSREWRYDINCWFHVQSEVDPDCVDVVCHCFNQMEDLLNRKFIPLLHGDVVFNSVKNFSILSG
jgi:isopentenyl phosphate kinase